MKNIVLSSVVCAALFFAGCSVKEPAVDKMAEKSQEKVQEVAPVKTEVVSDNDAEVTSESSMAVSDSSELSMADAEQKLATIYFDFDKYNIRGDMKDNLSNDASLANSEAKSFKIKLEGNCDEWGSDEYNFALGLRRTNSVKEALAAEGVDTSRITMVSYGESNPVCTNKTRECWAKNRRVDFKLLP
jgi:peptidoglycan-associated lipoprotein